MRNSLRGRVYVLGDDIDTDQIIPARYLVYSLTKPGEKEKYGEMALSAVLPENAGLPDGNIPFVRPGEHRSAYSIIIAGKNFGCGSSREHAPAALAIAGVQAVVAPSFARIFYRNAVDGGFLTPIEAVPDSHAEFSTGDEAIIDLDARTISNSVNGTQGSIKPLGQVAGIIEAGGIFAYARKTGMIGETPDVQ